MLCRIHLTSDANSDDDLRKICEEERYCLVFENKIELKKSNGERAFSLTSFDFEKTFGGTIYSKVNGWSLKGLDTSIECPLAFVQSNKVKVAVATEENSSQFDLFGILDATLANTPSSKSIVAKNGEHLKKIIKDVIKVHGFECDLNHIDVSNVIDMSDMFKSSKFNGDISAWKLNEHVEIDDDTRALISKK